MDLKQMKKNAIKEIEKIKDQLILMADTIHDNPEIGHQEYNAAEILTSFLKKSGFQVEKGIKNMDTAFIAKYKGKEDGPSIGLLCEYDALIGLGHACGHNLIGVGSVGAAYAVSKLMPQINGNLIVYGTPAEEGGVDNAGGKVVMADVFKETDACLIWHPGTRNAAGRKSSMAREAIQFEFFGKPAHAGAAPWEGINALNAVILMFRNIDALRQHVKPDVRLHGFIEKGGDAANIVPEHSIAKYYVRASDINYLNEVSKKVKNCAKAAALATGTEVKFWDYANTYANTIPNNSLADTLEKNLESLGIEITPQSEGQGGGSTDVGNVSQVTPITSLSVSIGPETINAHTKEFREAAKSEKGNSALIIASKVLAMTTLDLLLTPTVLEKVRNEWKSKLKV
jgi:amidohydrolase